MADHFEEQGDTLTTTQTRRGLRLAAGVGCSSVCSAVIGAMEIETTVACDPASGSCTLTDGRRTTSWSIWSPAAALPATIDPGSPRCAA